jgi:succinoglycan biosynthesis protein ExoO
MSVSVVIAAYNVQECIPRALESATSQSIRPEEILVIDDGSTDSTRDVVRNIARTNLNIRLIALSQNGGQARARNVGIQEATGNWIAILDADDAWKPKRLERLLRIADEQGAHFVADNQIMYDAVAKREGPSAFAVPWKSKRIDAYDLFANGIAEASFNFGVLKPIFRRDFLLRHQLKYDPSLRYGEDFALYAEMLFCGAIAFVSSEPLYIFSTRIGNLSGAASPHSRTPPDFGVMAKTSDELCAKYGLLINDEFRKIIARRRRYLMAVHGANVARDFRRAKRFDRYLDQVLRNPDVFALLVRRTYRRAIGAVGKMPELVRSRDLPESPFAQVRDSPRFARLLLGRRGSVTGHQAPQKSTSRVSTKPGQLRPHSLFLMGGLALFLLGAVGEIYVRRRQRARR